MALSELAEVINTLWSLTTKFRWFDYSWVCDGSSNRYFCFNHFLSKLFLSLVISSSISFLDIFSTSGLLIYLASWLELPIILLPSKLGPQPGFLYGTCLVFFQSLPHLQKLWQLRIHIGFLTSSYDISGGYRTFCEVEIVTTDFFETILTICYA